MKFRQQKRSTKLQQYLLQIFNVRSYFLGVKRFILALNRGEAIISVLNYYGAENKGRNYSFKTTEKFLFWHLINELWDVYLR